MAFESVSTQHYIGWWWGLGLCTFSFLFGDVSGWVPGKDWILSLVMKVKLPGGGHA